MIIETMIVPTLMRSDLLAKMIASIDHPIEHLIIINNGEQTIDSTCPKWIRRISVIDLPSNIGVPGSWNLGIKLTPYSKNWLIASDDIEWNPGGLKRYSDAITNNSLVADWRNNRSFCSFFVNEDVIRSVGLFDDYYYPGTGEELNYLLRCVANKVRLLHVGDAYQTIMGSTRLRIGELQEGAGDFFAINWRDSQKSGSLIRGWDIDRRRQFNLLSVNSS